MFKTDKNVFRRNKVIHTYHEPEHHARFSSQALLDHFEHLLK